MFVLAIAGCFVFTNVLTVVEEDQDCITAVLSGNNLKSGRRWAGQAISSVF